MLKEKQQNEAKKVLKQKFNYQNEMAIPRIKKVVVNTGMGRVLSNVDSSQKDKVVDNISQQLGLICGQKPIAAKARKSISEFKVKEGQTIGLKVTLRGERMYNFLDRLINLALPRTRDFQGISLDSVDKEGNLTIGIREHIAFPEVKAEEAKYIFGLEITVATSCRSKEKAIELLKSLGFPLKEKEE